jgi:hypothetical protein
VRCASKVARRLRSDFHGPPWLSQESRRSRPLPIMTNPIPILRKRDTREAMVRSVVDFAREVRVHLRDEQVIFGSIAQAAERCDDGSFRIRPWGMKQSIEVRFADVTLATPVKQMGWEQHRAIARAQEAGVFLRRTPKREKVWPV